MHTFILGAGFSGSRIAVKAKEFGTVCGTRRSPTGLGALEQLGIQACLLEDTLDGQVLQQLTNTTHLISCVAPQREPPLQDPMLALLQTLSKKDMPRLRWIGYLSTIGVYGDYQGDWIDESAECRSEQSRSIMRREAELAWQALGKQWSVPVAVFRLSGIYGPGRNAVEDALKGRARMIIKPGQVFNRIYVDDLANACVKAANLRFEGVLNITDDLPAPPQDIITYAHELVGRQAPPKIDFDTADLSPMARSFYSENKRVSNASSKELLGMEYQYPTYKHALEHIWASIQ